MLREFKSSSAWQWFGNLNKSFILTGLLYFSNYVRGRSCERPVGVCTQLNSTKSSNGAAAAAVTKVTPVKPTGPSKYFAHKQNVLLQRPPDYKAAKISQKNSKRFSSKFIAFQAKPDKIYLTYLPDQHA